MHDYPNPAGRIWAVLSQVSRKSNGNKSLLANSLGVADDWDSIMAALGDIRLECKLLEGMIEVFKDNGRQYALYSSKIPDIIKSVNSITINIDANSFQWSVLPAAVVSLEFIAANLPQEREVTRDDLEQIRQLCDELQAEILGCESLNKQIKAWLLDLVRLMRDGIDRFRIRGSRGMRRQFHEMLGSMMDHYAEAEEVKKQSPVIWEKMRKGFEYMNKASEFGERVIKVIGFGTYLAKIFGEDASTPPMLGN